jgi:DeoR/GlpR family transcriptional regulator of sugar metabolism
MLARHWRRDIYGGAPAESTSVFVEERQQQILDRLRAEGKVTVDELTSAFGVSAPTVRADLAALESRRLLRRTHGGALAANQSQHEPPYAERAIAQAGEKRRIAQAAAALIAPGETILLDAGTTTHEIGIALAASGKTEITIVTNNLPTAVALMDAPGLEVIVIGGQLQPRRRALLGPLAVEFLRPIRADRLFLGVSGVDATGGLTAADFDAVQVKRAMLACAASVVVVADASKIGQVAFAHVAPLTAASLLLTDGSADTETLTALREAGLGAVQVVP